MNNNQGALYFGAGIDLQQWRANMAEMRRDIQGLNTTTQQQTRQMDSSFRMVGTGLATYFSGAALANFTRQIIDVRGEFQKTEIAFGTMLKSTDKAKALMGQMVELAAKTPFSLQDVSSGAKQLLAFQVPAEQVVDTLTRMGNIAAGLGVPLSRINLVYGQVKAKGKLAGDDLRQFTEAGIPMLAELAKKFNTSTAEISKMVTAGKIGFKDVQDVLFSMTNEGGMFFNLMEKQSASLSGKIANLGDAFDQMLNSIGEANEGLLGDSIDSISYLVDNYETLVEIIGVAVVTFGIYKAALIATAAWESLNANAIAYRTASQNIMTLSQARGTIATVMLRNAQASLNATLMANPLGLVIGLVAGLTYVIYKNISATTAYEEIQGKLNENIRKYSTSVDEQKSKIETLIKVIKDKNTSDKVAQNALDQINKLTKGRINGLTVEGIRLGQNTKALNGYIQMMEKEVKLKALIDEKIELEKRNKDIDRDNPNNLTIGDRFTNFNGIGDVFKGLSAQERKERAMIENRMATNKRLKENFAETQKLMQEGVKLTDEIVNTPIANNTSDEKKKKAIKNKERELAEIYSLNSIADLEQRISLWNEALQKASGDNVQELTKNKFGDTVKTGNNVSVKNALQQLEELEKAKAKRLKEISIQSFEEQLTETKRQIEVRDKLLQQGYSKDQVDEMFPTVKDTSFLEYLTKLEASLSTDKTKEAGENIIYLKEVLSDFRGDETFLDGVNKSIDELKSKFSGDELIDKLEKFKNLDVGNSSESERVAKENATKKAQEEELERQRQFYQDFLKEKETFEEKKKNIDEKYNSLDDQINSSNKSADEKSRLLTESAKAKGREYSQAFLDSIKDTSMWEKAFSDIAKMTSREMKKAISDLKTQLATAKTNGATATEIKTIQDRITELQNALNTNPFEKIASSFNKLGDETLTTVQKLDVAKDLFNGLGEGVQMLGDAFGGFDEQTQDTVNSIMEIGNAAFDLGKSIASGDVAGMIQAGLKLIGSIGKAINGDKKKEREIKKQAAVLKELETAYNAVAFAAERMFGSQKYDGQRDLIRNLEHQKIAIESMMRSEDSKKKKDKEKIAGYQQQIQSINQSIEQLKEGIIKDVLQTDIPDMASKLGDALVDAFGRGEDSVKSLENAANDMIKNLLKNQLNLALQNKMKPILDKLLSASGFNQDGSGSFTGLTPEQIADFKAQVVAAGQSMNSFLEGYSEIFGGIDENAQGLKGDIKGITEKTAGALEAQMNAMRINQVSSLEVIRNSLLQLVAIEWNTRNLIQIRQDIAEMNGKMTKGLAGV